jgi:hypothetical protein
VGGEHLADVSWLIERDENALVVSITDQAPKLTGFLPD